MEGGQSAGENKYSSPEKNGVWSVKKSFRCKIIARKKKEGIKTRISH